MRRHAEGGDAALVDRSSRPIRMPKRTSDKVEKRVLSARQRRKWGAANPPEPSVAGATLSYMDTSEAINQSQVFHLFEYATYDEYTDLAPAPCSNVCSELARPLSTEVDK